MCVCVYNICVFEGGVTQGWLTFLMPKTLGMRAEYCGTAGEAAMCDTGILHWITSLSPCYISDPAHSNVPKKARKDGSST